MPSQCAPATPVSAPPQIASLVASLVPGAVHVWSAPLDRPPGHARALQRLLSAAERARAVRYRFERDRDRFIVRRGLLRVILGHYAGRPPDELVFDTGPYGKLELLDPGSGDRALRFNLSHSHGLALFAVSRDQEVGVDVERVRVGLPHADLVERYFSWPERLEYRQLPVEQSITAFFDGWTRKESVVKALGTGLVTRLDSFAVSLTPDAPARLLTAPAPGGRDAGDWTLASIDTIPGYAAAITVAGHRPEISYHPWPVAAASHGRQG